jgi:hypothetical protein
MAWISSSPELNTYFSKLDHFWLSVFFKDFSTRFWKRTKRPVLARVPKNQVFLSVCSFIGEYTIETYKTCRDLIKCIRRGKFVSQIDLASTVGI